MRRLLLLSALTFPPLLWSADAPDGTQFNHPVLSVDGPDLVRIKFCGMPLQVRLATVQLKGEASEKGSLEYLKSALKAGGNVKIELEPDAPVENLLQPKVHVFSGSTHLNVEVVKRGLAVSDGRSQKYGGALQAAQGDAMSKKLGVWADAQVAARPAPPAQPATPAKPATPEIEAAPASYSGVVVADLNSKEYHFPGSRFAKGIRAGARIEYKSPEEAERAGKSPSPFSFPDRARALVARTTASAASGSASPEKIVEDSRKALTEALVYMNEARRLSRTDASGANVWWKKAGKLLTDWLDKLTPVADASPDNKGIQKLTEDMSMNLYSCNKYQSL